MVDSVLYDNTNELVAQPGAFSLANGTTAGFTFKTGALSGSDGLQQSRRRVAAGTLGQDRRCEGHPAKFEDSAYDARAFPRS